MTHQIQKYGEIGGEETAEIFAKQLGITKPKMVKNYHEGGYDIKTPGSEEVQFSLRWEQENFKDITGYLIKNGAVRVTQKDINQLEESLASTSQ